MKKLLIAVAALGVIAAASYVLAPQVAAQMRARVTPDLNVVIGGSQIGVSIRDLDSDELAKAKLPQPGGALIEDVREGTPAARAGFRDGDIVIEFDGERVRSARHFTRLVQETPAGRTVQATVLRDGTRQTLQVTPEAGGRAFIDIGPRVSRELEARLWRLPGDLRFDFDIDVPRNFETLVSPRRLGATVAGLNSQLAEYFGVKGGVLVSSVESGSPAAQAGLRAGDVITGINGQAVDAVADVSRAVRNARPGDTLELRVTRDRKELTLKATIPDRPREPSTEPVLPV
ncbi:MAG TPA: PDZ domain-containing protein [Vicinamibacterales bacterium]|nr:PDZ domain-containing protein [Vicinamibacterales bacterium]